MAEAVAATERTGLWMATMAARRGKAEATREGLARLLGADPPPGSGVAAAEDLAVIGVAPETWLVVAEGGREPGVTGLADALRGMASVFRQDGAYVVLRLDGEGVGPLLQSGLAIDLHPAAFGPGSAVVSAIAHIGVIVWRNGDHPGFEVAVPRSLIGSFRDWLSHHAGGVSAQPGHAAAEGRPA